MDVVETFEVDSCHLCLQSGPLKPRCDKRSTFLAKRQIEPLQPLYTRDQNDFELAAVWHLLHRFCLNRARSYCTNGHVGGSLLLAPCF